MPEAQEAAEADVIQEEAVETEELAVMQEAAEVAAMQEAAAEAATEAEAVMVEEVVVENKTARTSIGLRK